MTERNLTGPIIRVHGVVLDLPVGRTNKRKQGAKSEGDVGGRLDQRDATHAWVRALDEVTVEMRPGERVGIIGHNGAGKSSLLRVMAGIYPPTLGTVSVDGTVSTLFTSTIGLNLDATGYENVILMGILLGFHKKRMESLIPEIAEFSELGDFLDMPLRTYSAGMRTRLGFAIATSVDPNCLLIDEVFGAGDRRFQDKASERIGKMVERANTVVMASHSSHIIETFCEKVLWLDHGSVRRYGPVEEILEEFSEGRQDVDHIVGD